MYASNEDEFNRDESDWVVLRQTPPTNTVSGLTFFSTFCILFYLFLLKILQEAVSLINDEQSNSSSSSSSSSDDSSSESDRSDISSSLSSTE